MSSNRMILVVFFLVVIVCCVFGSKEICQKIDCDSWSFKFKSCKVGCDFIKSVSVIDRRSESNCTQGSSFDIGEDCQSIWVDKGCRASFNVCKHKDPIICEGITDEISCDEGQIKITNASYGRHDRTTCCDPRVKTTDCHSENSMSVVSKLCNGKKSCNLEASNGVFGDPCVGTYKYLSVSYLCEKTGHYRTHPTNCSLFYQCDLGRCHELECSANLYFDTKLNVCNWQKDVDCEDGVRPPNNPIT